MMTGTGVGVVVREHYWLRKYDGDPVPENLVEVIEISDDGNVIASYQAAVGDEARALWEQIEKEIQDGADQRG